MFKQAETPKPTQPSLMASVKIMEIDEGGGSVAAADGAGAGAEDVSKQRKRSLADVTKNSPFVKMLTNSNSPRAQF